MISNVQCSICSQLNNKPRVVVTDFRMHHTCSIIVIDTISMVILWLHSLSVVIIEAYFATHPHSAQA